MSFIFDVPLVDIRATIRKMKMLGNQHSWPIETLDTVLLTSNYQFINMAVPP